jgi:hypothetical protein
VKEKEINVRLPGELHQAAREKMVREGVRGWRELVERLVGEWVGKGERG